ncbi:ShKT domain-containing protein [Strongyloides ratti]|uniref:ShKT domain-containing protein n=1 Tax=Strongyloides ratti TaxID=34506 RepID=A0A090LS36_STRRB|nr:ShKT domain-containing protein [Strongyloides ratti]CEF70408.1 ShKT domain-containing protein [Strongyloides ratti]
MQGKIFFYIFLINYINFATSTGSCYYPSKTIDNSCLNVVIDTVSYSKCTQGLVTLYCLYNADNNNYACCSDNVDLTMISIDIIEAIVAFTPPPILDDITTTVAISSTIGSKNNKDCVDLSKSCNLYKKFCNINHYQVICPNTCDSCGVTFPPPVNALSTKSICKDLSNNCSEMAKYCQDVTYINMMSSVCAATCKKCGDPSTWNNNTMIVHNPKTDKCKNDKTNCNIKTIYCQIFSC